MRGRQDPQVTLLAFIDLETRVPSDHPLRVIKKLADQALKALSPDRDRTGLAGHLVATAYNLVRMSKLLGQVEATPEARMA